MSGRCPTDPTDPVDRGRALREAAEEARAVCAREVARHRAEAAALRREHAELRRTAGARLGARPQGREGG